MIHMVLLTLVNVILQKVTTKRSMPKDHGADTIQEVRPLVFVCHCQVCVCVCVCVCMCVSLIPRLIGNKGSGDHV